MVCRLGIFFVVFKRCNPQLPFECRCKILLAFREWGLMRSNCRVAALSTIGRSQILVRAFELSNFFRVILTKYVWCSIR